MATAHTREATRENSGAVRVGEGGVNEGTFGFVRFWMDGCMVG